MTEKVISVDANNQRQRGVFRSKIDLGKLGGLHCGEYALPFSPSPPFHFQKIMSRVKPLPLCNSQAVTAYCLALQKLSVLSEAALCRLFLKRSDQQILQNILPV